MRSWLRVLAVVAAVGLVVACTRAPYTGRIQYNLIPNGLMNRLGESTYREMLSDARVERKGDDTRVLRKVGGRIARVANEPQYRWEYALIQDSTMNAWCLPGGKIGVFTGILPVLKNEAGMAFVMGHEVGHATARHGAERMSQQLTLLGGLAGLELYLANRTELDPKVRSVILGALGLGAQVGVLLPFSRAHEAEADIIGMMYMAAGGYPPAESIRVWERMDQVAGGGGPAFLSTHPSNRRRQENLRDWLPKARKRYLRNKVGYDSLAVLWQQGSSGESASGASGSRRPTGNGGTTTLQRPK